jgi:hypothetical protein
MNLDKKLSFNRDNTTFVFKGLEPNDVSHDYVNSLTKTSFIENIPPQVSVRSQKEYVQKITESRNSLIFGLFSNENILIATSGVQVNSLSFKEFVTNDSKYLTMGIFVVGKEHRGQGFGKMLVWACSYLLNSLFYNSDIFAGMKKDNIASLKSFTSVGYKVHRVFSDSKIVCLKKEQLLLPNAINQININ